MLTSSNVSTRYYSHKLSFFTVTHLTYSKEFKQAINTIFILHLLTKRVIFLACNNLWRCSLDPKSSFLDLQLTLQPCHVANELRIKPLINKTHLESLLIVKKPDAREADEADYAGIG